MLPLLLLLLAVQLRGTPTLTAAPLQCHGPVAATAEQAGHEDAAEPDSLQVASPM